MDHNVKCVSYSGSSQRSLKTTDLEFNNII